MMHCSTPAFHDTAFYIVNRIVWIIAFVAFLFPVAVHADQFHHIENGWHVRTFSDNFSHNDGFWYRRSTSYPHSFIAVQKISSHNGFFDNRFLHNNHQFFNPFLNSCGSYSGYGSGYSNGYGNGYSSSYGGYPNTAYTQRGNAVYGYQNFSYDSVKDPYADFKIQAEIERLHRLAEQVNKGSVRLNLEIVKVLDSAAANQAALRSQQLRATLAQQIADKISQVIDSALQVPAGNNNGGGIKIKSSLPNDDTPPSITARHERLLQTIATRCVRCHDGPNSINKSLDLRDLTKLDSSWQPIILDRLVTGDLNIKMPQGGPYLDQELVGDFYLFSGVCNTTGNGDKPDIKKDGSPLTPPKP